MARRKVFDDAYDGVVALLIETGCLKAVGIENGSHAAARTSLILSRLKQLATPTSTAFVFANPKVADLKTPCPRPPVQTGHHRAGGITQENGEPLAVVKPCLLSVVFVNLMVEISDVPHPRLGFYHECAVVHTTFPSDYSMIWSARASSEGGIVRPRDLAVLRLMASSNLVGCCTGRSAGLAPLRILSTYTAARPIKSAMFTAYAISAPASTISR